MLTEKRTEVKAALEAAADQPAGFTAHEYIGEALKPPCAAIVPAEPYLRGANEFEQIPFRRVKLGIDVLLISARSSAKAAAAQTDQLIEFGYAALRTAGYTVRSVSRPGVITVSGSKFIGSVLTIEELTEEPTNG